MSTLGVPLEGRSEPERGCWHIEPTRFAGRLKSIGASSNAAQDPALFADREQGVALGGSSGFHTHRSMSRLIRRRRLSQIPDSPRAPGPATPSPGTGLGRSEEHTSELRHVKISYAVFCLKKKTKPTP